MTRRGSSPVFIGRRAELARLDDAYARAATGQPSCVLVAGDAGVGKSRFVAEFSASVEAAGGRAITGGCLDLGEGGIPYAPFVEALRGLVRALTPEERHAAAASWADALGHLVPGLLAGRGPAGGGSHSSSLDATDAVARRARLFDAIIGVLGLAGADRPLALIIEDIHWADGSTRDLIRFLLRNLRHERVVLVATVRTDDLHRRHPLMPLLSELERNDRLERVDLRPFDRTEITQQLAGILGTAPHEAIIDALLRRSDGLPFYVEELVAADPTESGTIPATLRDILGLRLAQLSPGASAIVGVASVVGVRVELDQLRAAAGPMDEASILSGLREAIDARILMATEDERGPAYRFRHALLREAASDELLPAERVRAHGRLATYLASRIAESATPDPSNVADLAMHADLAGDQPGALAASVRALRTFVAATAFREALVHGERALELWPRVTDPETVAEIHHADLLALAAGVAADAGQARRAVVVFRSALDELGPDAAPERRLSLMTDFWLALWETQAWDAGTALAEEMAVLARAMPATSLAARAWTLIGEDRWSRGRIRDSVPAYETAMQVADAAGDPLIWLVAASVLAHSLADLGRAGRAEALLARADSISPRFDGTAWVIWSAVDRQQALWSAGRFDESMRAGEEAMEIAHRYGMDERLWHWLSGTDPLFELGRLDEVEDISRRLAVSVSADHPMLGIQWGVIKTRVVRGQLDDLPDIETEHHPPQSTSRCWDLEVLVWQDRAEARFDRLQAHVAEAISIAAGGDVDGIVWMLLGTAIGGAADEAVRLRERRRAADADDVARIGHEWFEALQTIVDSARADGGAGAFCEATHATALAELSRLDGGSRPELWGDAVGRWDAIGHRERGAYSRLRLAEATLMDGGDAASATSALRAARDAAADLRAAPLLAEIDSVARRGRIDLEGSSPSAGVSPPPGVTTSTLTSRERDVLRLVAAGHTNREIGDQLFISEKTVSVHVSNAMAKLGALSRYEAAATAQAQGWL